MKGQNAMQASDIIVGIDLGTTNSEVAVFYNGKVEVIQFNGEAIMPSVVGLAPDGNLLVGTPARNQSALYPEHTVASVKRLMGCNEPIRLGNRNLQPQEISAMILRELKSRAEAFLQQSVNRAVITVPAYFSDAQRQATHDAGVIAGFKVERIINEPTAASLAYAAEPGKRRLVLVYDLGGGTFDVSIVETQDGVTEVLASHGNPMLGGDDFDRLLLNEIVETLIRDGNPDVRGNRLVMSRLARAAINAKHELSSAPFAKIIEENLMERNGVPVHFSMEISRTRYEELIYPLVEKTFESVVIALQDSGRKASELDAVIPVGGMTRTPMILSRLEEMLGKCPRQDVHPDLAVASGAGIMASRLSGRDEGRVLVDITPYSFGPSVVSEGPMGFPVEGIFSPIIRKGTPLPARKTEVYSTMYDNQKAWNVEIYQGESPMARDNIRIGKFLAEGFSDAPAGNKVLCTLELDINGILHVTVLEKATGHTKRVRIENALGKMADQDIENARRNLDAFFAAPPDTGENPQNSWLADLKPEYAASSASGETSDISFSDSSEAYAEARGLIERANNLMPAASGEDREELAALVSDLNTCLAGASEKSAAEVMAELENLLYFIEES